MMVDKERLGGRESMVVSGAGRDGEGLGDGTRKSRRCAAYCVLYASLRLPTARLSEGCSSPPGFARDTPIASSTVRTRVGSKRTSGLQTTAATGLLGCQLLKRAPTCHRTRRVHRDIGGGVMSDEGSLFG